MYCVSYSSQQMCKCKLGFEINTAVYLVKGYQRFEKTTRLRRHGRGVRCGIVQPK